MEVVFTCSIAFVKKVNAQSQETIKVRMIKKKKKIKVCMLHQPVVESSILLLNHNLSEVMLAV